MKYNIPRVKNTRKGDGVRWYVEFYVWQHPDRPGRKIRIRKYDGIEQAPEWNQEELACKRRAYYEERLHAGWIPELSETRHQRFLWNDEIEHFLSDILKTRSKRTLQRYKSETKYFKLWLEGHKRNRDIISFSEEDGVQFRDFLLSQKKASGTVNGYLRTISCIMREAIRRHGIAMQNPFDGVTRLKKIVSIRVLIQDRDLVTIANHLDTHDPLLMLFLRFIFHCFIRPYAELRKMQIKWINFDDLTVTIPGDIALKQKKTHTLVIPEGKLSRGIQYLRNYNADDYVFTKSGIPGPGHIGVNTYADRFKKVVEELGLNKAYRPYCFKDTGAKKLVDRNVNVKYIQLQMRHSSLEYTDKYLRAMSALDSEELRKGAFNL